MVKPTVTTMGSSADRWAAWLKVASVLCTSIIVPGVGWAWTLSSDVHNLQGQVGMLKAQMDRDSRDEDSLRGDIRQLRETIESMKADVLQRLAKVETKLEK